MAGLSVHPCLSVGYWLSGFFPFAADRTDRDFSGGLSMDCFSVAGSSNLLRRLLVLVPTTVHNACYLDNQGNI